MRYPASVLDEIRARLPVSAVVGRKVRLKKAGREWKGLSPFNAEKTPSFYVNDQKGFYHCFSSGKHGDIFTFVMETEGLPFPEAVERLAQEAGVPLPKMSREDEVQEQTRKTLYDALEMACRFFEGQLQTTKGQQARTYLLERRVLPETQAEFRIGFAPDSRNALLDHLRSSGVDDEQILAAGLAIAPDDGRGIYDRFRSRIVIPIQDQKGRVVAFGGRALSPEAQPKYLNSPETELFKKGALVFNAHRAREAAHRSGSAVVVEGYLDAISVYQAGITSVVATLGTAFTEEQVEALWRLAPEPVVCFDGDKAGRAAAARAIDRIIPHVRVGRSFRFAFLPEGVDPDDLIKNEGPERFRALSHYARKFWDVLWAREAVDVDFADPDAVAALQKRLSALVGQIPDTQLRFRYELSTKLMLKDAVWLATREKLRNARGDVSPFSLLARSDLFGAEPTRLVGLERIFLGLCVEFPDFAAEASDRIAYLHMRGRHRTNDQDLSFQSFLTSLMDLIVESEVRSTEGIYTRIDPSFSVMLDHLHGRESSSAQAGHALRKRLPILDHHPPEEYLSRCFWHFLDMLVLRETEDELLIELNEAGPELEPRRAERLQALQQNVLESRELIQHRENELAEEANAYRMKQRLRALAA